MWANVCAQVSVLRLEVQRLNVARQQAETARQHAEERAAGSQAVAEALQRELAKVLAASDGPHAHQARAAVDADNARLRQQLEVRRRLLHLIWKEQTSNVGALGGNLGSSTSFWKLRLVSCSETYGIHLNM